MLAPKTPKIEDFALAQASRSRIPLFSSAYPLYVDQAYPFGLVESDRDDRTEKFTPISSSLHLPFKLHGLGQHGLRQQRMNAFTRQIHRLRNVKMHAQTRENIGIFSTQPHKPLQKT